MDGRKNLYKRFLKHVFGFRSIAGIAKAYRHKLSRIPVKEQMLACRIFFTAACNNLFFRHQGLQFNKQG
jgi:hypothetical protein